MKTVALVSMLILMAPPALALDLGELTDVDARAGLREALIQGTSEAVGKLGRKDGFLKNKKVKIPLPESLEEIDGVMRWFGMGDEAEELVIGMNRAAEAAVPEAKSLLRDALEQMTLHDAKSILSGGKTSGTDYFRKTAEAPLRKKFLPIVKRATGKVALTEKYDAVAGSAAKVGLIDEESATIHEYVTRKALDGLFFMLAREERAIRKNPGKQASSLLQKVFGALRE
jgi:hypothetical protein